MNKNAILGACLGASCCTYAGDILTPNVGIGTSSPEATLHIVDVGSSEPALLISGASASEGDIAVADADTLQIGNWDTVADVYTNWLQIDSTDISAQANNGYVSGTTATRLRIMGDNSFSSILNYSGYDHGQSVGEYREELALRGRSDIVGGNHDSAGAHFYGNNDSQHAGWAGIFTGGKSRLTVNYQGRVGVGSEKLLRDHENHYKGRFNIINPVNEPGLYIEGANGSEGDIAWKEGEYLQMGTWSANQEFVNDHETIEGTFNEIVTITHLGNLSIDNPVPGDNSPGYIQLDTATGTPPSSDCDSSVEVGRMAMDKNNPTLYVCSALGWRNVAL